MPRGMIIGAGLVGPVLAMYLTRIGWDVSIFERSHDPRSTIRRPGRSINLTLCRRGFDALAEIGAEVQVRDLSVPAYGRLIHDTEGNLTQQNYGSRGEAIYSIARNDLNRLLLDHSEREFNIRFCFNYRCIAVDPSVPSATFHDVHSGKIAYEEADVIFGADGAHSEVRRELKTKGLLAQHEQYWEQAYKEINVLAPAAADRDWRTAKNFLHFWPRAVYMLIGFPNVGGDFTCALHLPLEGNPSFQSLQTQQQVLELFRESFPDVLPRVPRLETNFPSTPVNKMITVRCKPWSYKGKVLLIGDAAHAIYPSYGQGANAGFEDCRMLKRALELEHGDCEKAFSVYEMERRPSMNAIADLCVEHFIEIRDRVGDPEFLRRKQIEQKISEMFPHLYSPLYSNITFTDMPYEEARLLDQQQRLMIDRIMENNLGPGDLDHVIRQVIGEKFEIQQTLK